MTAVDNDLPKARDWDVEVFYDGDCPFCRREINLLRRWDRKKRIRFTDIVAADFNPAAYGMEFDQFMAAIQGRLPNGEWIHGVEVFRRLYSAIGLSWLVALTRWPGFRQGLDWAYRIFARNRLRWTGRCTTDCRVENTR